MFQDMQGAEHALSGTAGVYDARYGPGAAVEGIPGVMGPGMGGVTLTDIRDVRGARTYHQGEALTSKLTL